MGPPKVAGRRRRGSLDFDSGNAAPKAFHHEVDLTLILVAVMAERRPISIQFRLLQDYSKHEALQQRPQALSLPRQGPRVRSL